MPVTINGTSGVVSPDGSAGTPAYQGSDANTGMFFPAADTIAFAEGGVEVARFNADAQFVVTAGTASLPVITTTGDTNTGIFFPAADTIAFGTNSTERARFNSSGNLLVGTTSGGASAAIAQFYNPTSNNCVSARVSSNGLAPFAAYNASDSVIFYVSGTGSIFAVSTAITAISDVRHKENIRDLDTGLEQVLALRPRRFDWKEGRGDGKKDVVGFIAQEVESVLPDVVGEWKEDLTKEESWKALATGNMIPTLVKAIQEQQALITSLTARIAALEGAAQ